MTLALTSSDDRDRTYQVDWVPGGDLVLDLYLTTDRPSPPAHELLMGIRTPTGIDVHAGWIHALTQGMVPVRRYHDQYHYHLVISGSAYRFRKASQLTLDVRVPDAKDYLHGMATSVPAKHYDHVQTGYVSGLVKFVPVRDYTPELIATGPGIDVSCGYSWTSSKSPTGIYWHRPRRWVDDEALSFTLDMGDQHPVLILGTLRRSYTLPLFVLLFVVVIWLLWRSS